jgi:hypothetical protein
MAQYEAPLGDHNSDTTVTTLIYHGISFLCMESGSS